MIVIGKIIEIRIKEVDFSEVQSNKPMTNEEMVEALKEQYRFEDDKTELNERIKIIIGV
jgi:hypothetical protein